MLQRDVVGMQAQVNSTRCVHARCGVDDSSGFEHAASCRRARARAVQEAVVGYVVAHELGH